jgi:hypothetical protein
MGRCNNQRTQAAAEALRNTPARARFSKRPPSSSSGRGRGRGRHNNNHPLSSNVPSDHQQNSVVVNRTNKMIPAHLAVAAGQKIITQRLKPSSTIVPTTAVVTTSHGITSHKKHHGISNLQNLDTITLSESSIQLMFQLLRDLHVVVVHELPQPNDDDDDDLETTINIRTTAIVGVVLIVMIILLMLILLP